MQEQRATTIYDILATGPHLRMVACGEDGEWADVELPDGTVERFTDNELRTKLPRRVRETWNIA